MEVDHRPPKEKPRCERLDNYQEVEDLLVDQQEHLRVVEDPHEGLYSERYWLNKAAEDLRQGDLQEDPHRDPHSELSQLNKLHQCSLQKN